MRGAVLPFQTRLASLVPLKSCYFGSADPGTARVLENKVRDLSHR